MLDEMSRNNGEKPIIADYTGSLEPAISWDLERMMKAINSPSVRMPNNIKDYGGFNKWVNSLTDEDFKTS